MRYARHISLSEVVAAGAGTIGVVDGDTVDESNLQRQVLFSTKDVGRAKVSVAKERLAMLNADVLIQAFQTYLTADNAIEIIQDYDLVIDGTDNFATRYLVNDACVKLDKPFIYGAIHKFEGQVSVFNWKGGPTYRCLFPEPPTADQIPNCAEAGVLGVLPGVIGTLQATEAMKIILGIGEPLSGKLKMMNLLSNSEQVISFSRNEEQIEKAKQVDLVNSYADASCSSEKEIETEQFQSWLEAGKDINILDVREAYETPKLELPNVISIPLGEIPLRFKELPSDKALVVVCQKGIRSQRAIDFLKQNNYQNQLINLKGGMAVFHQQIVHHE